jgi:23S rRNA (cytosine1962-C5)-methyltransferase
MTNALQTPARDYALLASGDGRKLERFGPFILDRPAPQAIWPQSSAPGIGPRPRFTGAREALDNGRHGE